jgi:hypothetical protein
VAETVTLQSLGIEEDDHDGVRVACIPIARRIVQAQKRIVGLVPASAEIGITAVGIQLGLALIEITGSPAAYVDANVRWPAISDIALGQRPEDEASMFSTRWLRGTLALVTPPRAGAAGAGLPQLARVIQRSGELFSQMVVDLTGFKTIGEHLAAVEMMDGVVAVARAGLTREDELLRLDDELPRHLNLGVLIAGAQDKRIG